MKKLLMFAATAAILAACTPKTAPELPLETFFRNTENPGKKRKPHSKRKRNRVPVKDRKSVV